MITQEDLRQLFSYCPSGRLIWLSDQKSNKVKGLYAGSLNRTTGYFSVRINKKAYRLHQLIYLWHFNTLPECIDHINRDPMDNRIENLRAATRSQNMQNSKARRGSKSKHKGVSLHHGKWRARIQANGKLITLGKFDSEYEAAIAYNNAAKIYHGSFANLNNV